MTSTFILALGEEFIQCPYNTAHQITNARVLTHLDKCRKAYLKGLSEEAKKKNIKICRHNATHHIPSPELRFHESHCVDALSVVHYNMTYHGSGGNQKKPEETPKPKVVTKSSLPSTSTWAAGKAPAPLPLMRKPAAMSQSTEDWEADSGGYTAGYNPESKLKNEVVIYNPSGLTKSERKKFRNEVRQKAQTMSLTGESLEFPTATTFPTLEAETTRLENLRLGDKDKKETPITPDANGNYETRNDDWSVACGLGKNNNYLQTRDSSKSYSASSSSPPGATGGAIDADDKPWMATLEETDSSDSDSDDFAGYDPYA